jgi:hypothetical protein
MKSPQFDNFERLRFGDEERKMHAAHVKKVPNYWF